MNILLNATTLKKGGALQACLNFIFKAIDDSALSWSFAISKEVGAQLQAAGFDFANDSRFFVLEKSPARHPGARAALKSYERELKPEAVFTFFGPAYVRFTAQHFMGFADPWVTHPNTYANKAHATFSGKIKTDLTVWYKKSWLKHADFWIVEAEVAKKGLLKLLAVDSNKISVVPNSCRDEFRGLSTLASSIQTDAQVRILFISTYYIHKNFEIIPDVANRLKQLRPMLDFKFVLTLPVNIRESKAIFERANSLKVGRHLENTGPVAVIDATRLYESCHMAFIPTLLETFSATYSEAMAAGLPIVTTDFTFARDICQDAALYYSPDSPSDAAERILKVIDDADYRTTMISRGRQIIAQLPNSNNKYDAYKYFLLSKISS